MQLFQIEATMSLVSRSDYQQSGRLSVFQTRTSISTHLYLEPDLRKWAEAIGGESQLTSCTCRHPNEFVFVGAFLGTVRKHTSEARRPDVIRKAIPGSLQRVALAVAAEISTMCRASYDKHTLG
jgi:hypothetical protein